MKKLVAAIALALASLTASADVVTCPGVLGADGNGITVTRQIQVGGGLVGGECYYQLGNIIGDNATPVLGTNTLIEKDIATTNQGTFGTLQYTTNSSARLAGTWSITQNVWDTYAEVFIALHFGGGGSTRDPDSFYVELDPYTLSGTWSLIPTNLGNGLSNMYLFGRGTPEYNVDEPAGIALAGLGLLALGLRKKKD